MRLARAHEARAVARLHDAAVGERTHGDAIELWRLEGLAAAGGILFGLDQTKLEPLMGNMIGLKAFIAAVLGGIGNIRGAAIGGLLIGVAELMTAGYISSDYRDAITFVILIVILLFRPQGLLGVVRQEKV